MSDVQTIAAAKSLIFSNCGVGSGCWQGVVPQLLNLVAFYKLMHRFT
jgi:hypothetical protein